MNKDQDGTLHKTLNAGHWTVINIAVQKVFSIITFFILARILTPEDFGIFSIATIVPGFIYYFSSPSFGLAVVQSSEDNTSKLNAIWTFNILRSCITFILTFIFGSIISHFFHAETASLMIRLGGTLVLLQSLANIGELYFAKNMDFKKLFLRDLVSRGAYAVVAIAVGLITHSYWALFLAAATLEGVGSLMTYFLSPYRPKLNFNFSILKSLLPFGKWAYAQNILGKLSSSIESILIARYTSASDLGLYGKAHTLATVPSPIGSMINKIGMPAIARIQNERTKILDGVYMMFDVMQYFTIPFVAIILVGGHRIILILLGEQWQGMENVLGLLTIAMSINMIFFTLNEPVFNGIGKPRIQANLLTLYTIVFILGLLLLVPKYGIIGATWTILIASILTSIQTLKKLSEEIDLKLIRVLKTTLTTSTSAIIVYMIGKVMLNVDFFNIIEGYLLLLTLLGAIYFILVFLFKKIWDIGPQDTVNTIIKHFSKAVLPSKIYNQLDHFYFQKNQSLS